MVFSQRNLFNKPWILMCYLQWKIIDSLHSLFSLFFEIKWTYYLPLKVAHQNSTLILTPFKTVGRFTNELWKPSKKSQNHQKKAKTIKKYQTIKKRPKNHQKKVQKTIKKVHPKIFGVDFFYGPNFVDIFWWFFGLFLMVLYFFYGFGLFLMVLAFFWWFSKFIGEAA